MAGKNRKHLNPEEFVKLWQKAKSAREVAEAAGITVGSARVRAWSYRKRGIQLKNMPGGSKPMDAESLSKLSALAKSLAAKS